MSRSLKLGVLASARSAYAELLRAEDGIELLASDPAEGHEALMARRPDAVVIGGDGPGVLDAVRAATAGGAHILRVGPLAATTADAEEIVRLAADAGVLLVTGSPLRVTDAFRTLAARVGRGDVGEVLGILGSSTGAFPLDLLDPLVGEPASWVRAVAGAGGVVTIGYPSGSFATVDGSGAPFGSAAIPGEVRLQVTGALGSISMTPGRHVAGTTADGPVLLPFGADPELSLIRHFVACVRDGVTPEPDATAGLRATRIGEAALESATTGRTVRLTA